MSEFKFACPVCGQHITADSNATGSELSCPTCFRKIVVPQAPKSTDPKFVLSAAEANKPKPPQALKPEEPALKPPEKPTSPVPLGLIVFLVLACAAGATLFVLRGRIFPPPPEPEVVETVTNSVVVEKSNPQPSLWSLELGTNVTFPEGAPSGKVHEQDFNTGRVFLQGGTLTLREGSTGPINLGLNIFFYATVPEQLSGKSINVRTNDPVAPRVVLRWRDGDQTVTQNFTGGYALRLDFGAVRGNRLPGKIFICLPDSAKSYVAGSFSAEIRRPPAPKKPPRR